MNDDDLIQRLERIEAALNTIITQRRIKEHYSTTEVATTLDRMRTPSAWTKRRIIWKALSVAASGKTSGAGIFSVTASSVTEPQKE